VSEDTQVGDAGQPDAGGAAIPGELPVLPLLGTVVYPMTVVPLAVAQGASIRLVDAALAGDGLVALAARDPGGDEFFTVGTVARVHRLLRLPDGTLRIAAEGLERCEIGPVLERSPFLRARVALLPDSGEAEAPLELLAEVAEGAEALLEAVPGGAAELRGQIRGEQDPRRLSFLAAQAILFRCSLAERQSFLTLSGTAERLALLASVAARELQALRRRPAPAHHHTEPHAPEPTPAPQPRGGPPREGGASPEVAHAREVLAAHVVGLAAAREAALERLAARALRLRRRAEGGAGETTLCLVGPAGSGKSALARAMALAAGAQHARVVLAATRTAEDIRGRPGEPGALLRALARSGVEDPLLELDGVDRLSDEAAAALLLALDPEERGEFPDRARGVWDLSPVLFVAAARDAAAIPAALREQLELVELPELSAEERLEVARRILLPAAAAAQGLYPDELGEVERALPEIVASCASAPGVREVELRLAALCRRAALRAAR
jgi:ATP-dependent Lon protease